MSQIPKLKVDKSSTIILARHPKLAEQLSEPMEIEQEFREVPPSQNVSLVIGIDIWLDENGKQIACYPSAKKNCLGICEALKDLGYGIFGNRPVLASEIHKQYGYMTIQTIMSTFFKKINSTQSAIFYFCGPMLTKDGILCTAQTRLFNPEIGGIQMQYLQSLLKFSMARQTLFVFDGFLSSIYSGKGRDYEIGSPWEVGKIPDSYQVTMTTFYEKLQRLVLPKGIVSSTGALPRQSYGLIAFAESSDPGQESLTVSTKTLIEALKPKNADNMGKITLDSIWKYIEFNLNAAAHHRSFALFDKNRELVIAQSE